MSHRKKEPSELRESLPGPQVAKLADSDAVASFNLPTVRHFTSPYRKRSRLPEAITIAIVGCHWI